MTTDAAVTELVTLVKRAHTLSTIGDLLGWDEQVNLAPGGAEQRAEQHAAMAAVQHTASSDPRIGELLNRLEEPANSLTPDQKAIVVQARRDYDRATKLPTDFVREKATQGSRGYHAWARARP